MQEFLDQYDNKATIQILENQLVVIGNFATVTSIEIILEKNAKLEIYEYTVDKKTLVNNQNVKITQKSNSNLKWVKIIQATSDHILNISVTENNCVTEIYNIVYPLSTEKISIEQNITSQSSNNKITHKTKSVVKSSSTVSIKHSVCVPFLANNTEVNQKINVINTNKLAKINLQPTLEIESANIKCEHGASIGSIDEVQLRYMSCRGLDLEKCTELITKSNFEEIINKLDILCVKEQFYKLY